jgi:hypothetical protein
MVLLNRKYKASTIMESIIAMIIIVVCFGIGTMMYTNILDSDKQRNQLKALLLLNEETLIIKKEGIYLDLEKKIGEWTLKRSIEPYQNTENLIHLSLSITDQNGKEILTRHEVITVNQ